MMMWFLVLDLDFRLKVIYLEIELKVLVDSLSCNLIVWFPYTGNGSIKKILEMAVLFNRATCISKFVLRPDHVV